MIEIRGLSKSYGSLHALRDVDLSVAPGEFCVVLGPSGAGKSTLLGCINRLVQPDAGKVVVGGHAEPTNRAQLRALRRDVGMVFQDHNLVPRMSVLKNVLLARLAHLPTLSSVLQMFPQNDVDLAMQCLRRVDLADRAWSRSDKLSGGQQQRVGIARAIAQQPKVILADEPVASLDPNTARLVLGDLKCAATELSVSVLCNLHQVTYATEFADRIVGMRAGRVVFSASPARLDSAALHLIYGDAASASDSASGTV